MNAIHGLERIDESPILEAQGLARATLSIEWEDGLAHHRDELHVERLSVWREADLLPPDIGKNLPGMRVGDLARAHADSGDLTGPWNPDRVLKINTAAFDRNRMGALGIRPRVGRFYPQGFFNGVADVFGETILPARILEIDGEQMTVDFNHPLARLPVDVGLHVDEILPGHDRRGGRCIDPLYDLLRHPGMAAPLPDGIPTDFGDSGEGLTRLDERDDGRFYASPRMVQHLDARALETIGGLYAELLPPGADVLDLMGSFDSHLAAADPASLTVLGMNPQELAANALADRHMVQDLNAAPLIDLPTHSMDGVVSTASIEYLVDPVAVLREVRRVLRPGGRLVVTFSNRWFPTKAIRIWSELHEFERLGLVTQWLQRAGFGELHTFSSRGWPRPTDDPHAHETPLSDPVYAVWGTNPEIK